MSVIPVTRTNTSAEEVVSEYVAPHVDVGMSPAPDVIADHDPGRSPVAVQLRPAPSQNGATRTVAAPGPIVRISPLDLRPPRHYPPRLDFLEPAETGRAMDPSSWLVGEKSATPIMTALANMSTRRLLILAAGLLLLMAGLFALRIPVFLGDFDQWGFQINCGSGLRSAFSQARIADSTGNHFVDRCATAIAVRRAWTIPLAVAGGLSLSALLISPSRGRSANVQTAGAAPRRQVSRTVVRGQDIGRRTGGQRIK
jgi:hypothetical protein